MTKSENTLENIFSMTRFVETAIAALELKTVSNVSYTNYNTVNVLVEAKEIKSREGCTVISHSGSEVYTYKFNGIEFFGVESVGK